VTDRTFTNVFLVSLHRAVNGTKEKPVIDKCSGAVPLGSVPSVLIHPFFYIVLSVHGPAKLKEILLDSSRYRSLAEYRSPVPPHFGAFYVESLANGAHEKPEYDHGSANQPMHDAKRRGQQAAEAKGLRYVEISQIFLLPTLRLRSSRSSSISSFFCVFPFAVICSAIIIRLIHNSSHGPC